MSSRTSKNPRMRHLFFIEAQCDFEFSCMHIPGKCNNLADDLSRNGVYAFLSEARNILPFFLQLLNLLLDIRKLIDFVPTGQHGSVLLQGHSRLHMKSMLVSTL